MALDPATAQVIGQGTKEMANIPFNLYKTLTEISDQKRARQFQEGFALLTTQQQQQFQYQMLNASTDTDRLAILMQGITAINLAKVNNASSGKNTALIAVVAVAVVLLIAVFLLNK